MRAWLAKQLRRFGWRPEPDPKAWEPPPKPTFTDDDVRERQVVNDRGTMIALTPELLGLHKSDVFVHEGGGLRSHCVLLAEPTVVRVVFHTQLSFEVLREERI